MTHGYDTICLVTTIYVFFSLVSVVTSFAPNAFLHTTSTATYKNKILNQLYASSTSSSSSVVLQNGLIKTILQPGNGPPLKFGDVATVSYRCYVGSDGEISNANKEIFSQSPKQKVIVGGGTMVDGWEQGLQSMKVGEKAMLSIQDPKLGYGPEGVTDIIPPNAILEIELSVLEVEEQMEMGSAGAVASLNGMTGSGDWGNLDPLKPRNPQAIDAAYKARQQRMAMESKGSMEKEGIAGFLDKLQSGRFYFFGLFEGETGQRAPWFLRPSITFPIAFAVVGAGFYATYALGGISERGSQIRDELDDVILSFHVMKTMVDSVTV